MELFLNLIELIGGILFTFFIFIFPLIWIAKRIKIHSDRKYEIERYKAETERMRAEAEMRKTDNSSSNNT